MAKKKQDDPARTHPLTIPFLRKLGALDVLKPPEEAFDPHGPWTHTYRLWLVQRYLSGGALTLRREPAGESAVRLHVDFTLAERGGYARRTHAELLCANDALASPRSWTLRSEGLGLDGRPIATADVAESSTLRGGTLETRFGGRSHTRTVPTPITSNWSLLDAVQRLDGANTKPLEFAMLDEMDLLKPEQRLEFRETTTLELAGRTLRLRGYQQIGRGVLPWQYWVDDQGRLLLAFSGVRALIYDPTAPQWAQKMLDTARARAKRRYPPR